MHACIVRRADMTAHKVTPFHDVQGRTELSTLNVTHMAHMLPGSHTDEGLQHEILSIYPCTGCETHLPYLPPASVEDGIVFICVL